MSEIILNPISHILQGIINHSKALENNIKSLNYILRVNILFKGTIKQVENLNCGMSLKKIECSVSIKYRKMLTMKCFVSDMIYRSKMIKDFAEENTYDIFLKRIIILQLSK